MEIRFDTQKVNVTFKWKSLSEMVRPKAGLLRDEERIRKKQTSFQEWLVKRREIDDTLKGYIRLKKLFLFFWFGFRYEKLEDFYMPKGKS